LFFGFEPQEAFIVHFVSIAIGHLNHANLSLDYGPLKYIFNNPKMHIWHHAKKLPLSHPNGMNFGISLSIWDYIFKTAYIPHDGRDVELGFDGDENFPKTIVGQSLYPFIKKD
jgi:sterol desaturase/sphingolipid hydroxylase (fatty acid hydroxylase superfamily)